MQYLRVRVKWELNTRSCFSRVPRVWILCICGVSRWKRGRVGDSDTHAYHATLIRVFFLIQSCLYSDQFEDTLISLNLEQLFWTVSLRDLIQRSDSVAFPGEHLLRVRLLYEGVFADGDSYDSSLLNSRCIRLGRVRRHHDATTRSFPNPLRQSVIDRLFHRWWCVASLSWRVDCAQRPYKTVFQDSSWFVPETTVHWKLHASIASEIWVIRAEWIRKCEDWME